MLLPVDHCRLEVICGKQVTMNIRIMTYGMDTIIAASYDICDKRRSLSTRVIERGGVDPAKTTMLPTT